MKIRDFGLVILGAAFIVFVISATKDRKPEEPEVEKTEIVYEI